MLSDEVINKVSQRLVTRIEEANTYILEQIALKIKEIGSLTPTQTQQLEQILKYGGDYDKIVKKLTDMTRLNSQDINDIFQEVAKNDYNFAEKFYNYRNINYIPFDENTALQNQINAFKNMAIGDYLNLSRTDVLGYMISDFNGNLVYRNLSQTYIDVIDKAILSVSQGKSTFDNEMYRIIKELGVSGLKTVEYTSGRTMRLDSAVRMNLQSGLRNLHNENQIMFGKEFDADGVEISVHGNPAPDHAEAQGRQFSIKSKNGGLSEWEKLQTEGRAKDYTGKTINIHSITKKGMSQSFRPISEYNCYHYIFSVVLGISEPEYKNEDLQEIIDNNNKGFELDGEHYTNYEGTQLQRSIERKIREQKDIQIMGKASNRMDIVAETQGKISQLTKKYKELSEKSGLPTQTQRMRVSNYKRVAKSKLK